MTARVNSDSLINSLRDLYGETITSADVRGYCASNGVSYPTVTKYLDDYKSGRGKWNLTVQEARQQLETCKLLHLQLFLLLNKTLSPLKMIPSSSLAISVMLKKLFSPVSSTLRLSRVSRAMVKRFLSNKRVPNSDENSSV